MRAGRGCTDFCTGPPAIVGAGALGGRGQLAGHLPSPPCSGRQLHCTQARRHKPHAQPSVTRAAAGVAARGSLAAHLGSTPDAHCMRSAYRLITWLCPCLCIAVCWIVDLPSQRPCNLMQLAQLGVRGGAVGAQCRPRESAPSLATVHRCCKPFLEHHPARRVLSSARGGRRGKGLEGGPRVASPPPHKHIARSPLHVQPLATSRDLIFGGRAALRPICCSASALAPRTRPQRPGQARMPRLSRGGSIMGRPAGERVATPAAGGRQYRGAARGSLTL